MNAPSKSSNSDLVIPLFFGALFGGPTYALFTHIPPDSFPHAAIAWIAHLGGIATTATSRAAIAAGIVGALGLIVGVLLDGIVAEQRKDSAAMKDVRESRRRERLKAKLDGKVETAEEDRAWEKSYGTTASDNRATPAFVVSLLAAAIVIVAAVEFVLSRSH